MYAFVTEMNAQDVANVIQAFYHHAGQQRHFKLAYSDARDEHHEVWVRPCLTEQPITLANNDQIVRCETNDGRRVDIIVPAMHREYQPATVVIAT
jgi:hypothetical protein